MSFGAVLDILNWVKDKLPIQDRKERWKNQLDQLEKEKQELLKGEWSAKKATRYNIIVTRINDINKLFKNADKG